MKYFQIWATFQHFLHPQLKWTCIEFLACLQTLFISTMISLWWNPLVLIILFLSLAVISSTDQCQFNAMKNVKMKRSPIKSVNQSATRWSAITTEVIVPKFSKENHHLWIEGRFTKPASTLITLCWTRISVRGIEEWSRTCRWLGLFLGAGVRRTGGPRVTRGPRRDEMRTKWGRNFCGRGQVILGLLRSPVWEGYIDVGDVITDSTVSGTNQRWTDTDMSFFRVNVRSGLGHELFGMRVRSSLVPTSFIYISLEDNIESNDYSSKVGCVFPIVVVSILPNAEIGQNDREDAPHFINLAWEQPYSWYSTNIFWKRWLKISVISGRAQVRWNFDHEKVFNMPSFIRTLSLNRILCQWKLLQSTKPLTEEDTSTFTIILMIILITQKKN